MCLTGHTSCRVRLAGTGHAQQQHGHNFLGLRPVKELFNHGLRRAAKIASPAGNHLFDFVQKEHAAKALPAFDESPEKVFRAERAGQVLERRFRLADFQAGGVLQAGHFQFPQAPGIYAFLGRGQRQRLLNGEQGKITGQSVHDAQSVFSGWRRVIGLGFARVGNGAVNFGVNVLGGRCRFFKDWHVVGEFGRHGQRGAQQDQGGSYGLQFVAAIPERLNGGVVTESGLCVVNEDGATLGLFFGDEVQTNH